MKEIKGTRYEQLLKIIDLIRPKTIIEIGTFDGDNAIRMIQRAREYTADVTYIGYDLFEAATTETDKEEFNVKEHHSVEVVGQKLKDACPGVIITLIRGNTRETLKNKIRADLVFVDGGHSIETIVNDYEAVRQSSVIILDDFYMPDPSGAISDTSRYGCNQLVSGITNGIILPVKDKVSGGGMVAMALVVNK